MLGKALSKLSNIAYMSVLKKVIGGGGFTLEVTGGCPLLDGVDDLHQRVCSHVLQTLQPRVDGGQQLKGRTL